MRLLNKKNNGLLPLFLQSAVLLAQEGAEFHLQDADLVSLNNTQLISVEGGNHAQWGTGSFTLNQTASLDLSISVASELAFFWNDYPLLDLDLNDDQQIWILSMDCDASGTPRKIQLQPMHWLVIPSAGCLESRAGEHWQLTSILFKPQTPVSSEQEMKTYRPQGRLSETPWWFPGVSSQGFITDLDLWPHVEKSHL